MQLNYIIIEQPRVPGASHLVNSETVFWVNGPQHADFLCVYLKHIHTHTLYCLFICIKHIRFFKYLSVAIINREVKIELLDYMYKTQYGEC